jgi:hypothetical protein
MLGHGYGTTDRVIGDQIHDDGVTVKVIIDEYGRQSTGWVLGRRCTLMCEKEVP